MFQLFLMRKNVVILSPSENNLNVCLSFSMNNLRYTCLFMERFVICLSLKRRLYDMLVLLERKQVMPLQ